MRFKVTLKPGERIILLPPGKATKNLNYLVNIFLVCLHPRASNMLNFQQKTDVIGCFAGAVPCQREIGRAHV